MTSRERIQAVLEFRKPDRVPIIEWAPHWNLTIDRWHAEGLPAELNGPEEINAYFGLDYLAHTWVRPFTKEMPAPSVCGGPLVSNEKEYDDWKKEYLYPNPAVDPKELERLAQAQADGAAVWFIVEGFFWHPRTLLGIADHLCAFYDNAALMNRIDNENLEFIQRATEEICRYVSPQFVSIAEDMSYNHGPMISKSMFEQTQKPFYERAMPFFHSKGIKVFVDSDGLVDQPVQWYEEAGADGFLPLERQAGVDLPKYRDEHPGFLFLGGFDKLCMNQGEEAMRREFERLLPVMRSGGYIPGVDHQTPPEVSIEDYWLYLSLLKEYCEKAVRS